MGELSGPIRPEVDVDDGITVAERAVGAVDDRGRDELVGLTTLIGSLDRGRRRCGVEPGGMDDGVVAALDPLPAPVAVHGVVAAADGCDADVRVHRSEPILESLHETQGRARWRVAAVEQRVDADGRDAEAGRQLHEGDEMTVVGMDAARPDEADGVEAACLLRALARGQERRAGEEGAIGDRGVDPGEVLEHRPARPEVQVTHLGVAHLAGGQADGVLRRPQRRVRPARDELTPARHRGGGDGVLRRVRADPEPVEDHENDGPRSGALGHEASPRAAAVRPARATIPAISSGFSEAPPMSAPSTPGSARNSAMFAEVTLPP